MQNQSKRLSNSRREFHQTCRAKFSGSLYMRAWIKGKDRPRPSPPACKESVSQNQWPRTNSFGFVSYLVVAALAAHACCAAPARHSLLSDQIGRHRDCAHFYIKVLIVAVAIGHRAARHLHMWNSEKSVDKT